MDPWEAYDMMQSQIAQNNAWNAEQAQKQMDFQERMSSTAHAREVADLKASGLNPVLSAKLGGASTPSGAMAQSDPSATSALMNIIDRMLDVTQAQAYGNAYSAKGNADSETEMTDQDTGNLIQMLLTGRGNATSAKSLGKGIRVALDNTKKLATNVYNWFTGKGSGNKGIDDFTNKANTWLNNVAYPWIGQTASNIGKGFNDFTKKVGTWIGNSIGSYGDAVAKSNDVIYGTSYTPKYNHGINNGLAFKNIVKPFSPEWHQYQKRFRYNPYKDKKNNYDPYQRIGRGTWLKQYK